MRSGSRPTPCATTFRRLEKQDILDGYAPLVDYEQAGYQLEVNMICSASMTDRSNRAGGAGERWDCPDCGGTEFELPAS
jgi:DNA-binding Lrp family transcriptional regulator